jgi:hypothetical protein
MSFRSARRRLARVELSTTRNPSGVGVTSYVPVLAPNARGSRRALELPALKTFAVKVFM